MKKFLLSVISLIFLYFLVSCGSRQLIFQKEGLSYEQGGKSVITFNDLRKWYDFKEYKNLFKTLEPVLEMKKMDDYFIHFLLIESGFYEKEMDQLKEYYTKSPYKYFFLGMEAYLNSKYDIAVKYFELADKNNPIVQYFIGSSYLFGEQYAQALGYLLLARDWENAPWPYLGLAFVYEIQKKMKDALENLDQARDHTFDFEENLIIDIMVKKTEVLFNQRNYEDALFVARKIYDRDKEKSIILADPGDILLGAGKKDEARVFWQKVMQEQKISERARVLVKNKLDILELIEK